MIMICYYYIAANKDESSSSSTDVTPETSGAANSDSDKVSGCNLSVWFYGFHIIKVTYYWYNYMYSTKHYKNSELKII